MSNSLSLLLKQIHCSKLSGNLLYWLENSIRPYWKIHLLNGNFKKNVKVNAVRKITVHEICWKNSPEKSHLYKLRSCWKEFKSLYPTTCITMLFIIYSWGHFWTTLHDVRNSSWKSQEMIPVLYFHYLLFRYL
jgi:hypothetical protein